MRPALQRPAAHHLLAIHAPEMPPRPWPVPLSFTLCVHGCRASPRDPLQGDGKACSGHLAFSGSRPCCAHAPQRWGWGAPHLDGGVAGNCQGGSPVPGASPRARCLQSECVAVRLTCFVVLTVLVKVLPEISPVMIINTQVLGESQKEGD